MRLGSIGGYVSGTTSNGVPATVPTVDDFIRSALVATTKNASPGELGYTNDRATMIGRWTTYVASWCAMYPFACSGYDVAGLIAAGVDEVLAGRITGFATDDPTVMYFPAQNVSCGSGYVPSGSSTGPLCVPVNTLTYVAPTQVTVSPMPPTNVLTPPTAQQTPTQQQIANGQTVTGGMLTNTGFPDLSGATSWVQSNWPILAAGVATVILLPMLMGGRK